MTNVDQQSPEEARDDSREAAAAEQTGHGGHAGHGRWAMIACCIPMLVIAGLLVAQGAGTGFLLVAVGCTLLMGLMMAGMGGHER